MKLDRQILLGFGAGIAAGFTSRVHGAEWLQHLLIALEPVGAIFIRLISMVVVPLVIASVFVGVASLNSVRTLGRVGGKTLAYFLGTTFVAAAIGLLAALAMHVGAGLSAADRDALAGHLSSTATAASAATPSVGQAIVNMVPQNPFASAAQGGADLLPLIIAVCIFVAAATVTDTRGRRAVVQFFEGVNDISMVVIDWLMRLAPPAVFALIASTVAQSGLGVLDQLLEFALVVLVALAIHVGIVLAPALIAGARLRAATFLRAVSDAILLAFSTASSNATLPVSMAAARERLGVSNEIVGFVLPPGASLNKNGSAAYKAVTAVFIAHLYGMSITGSMSVTIVLMATIAAFAGAGVPGSSLVTTLIVLDGIGLGPRAAAGIALVAAVDRPIDMCRSMVNTISNLVGAAWIARSEGQLAEAR
ncbi:MAG TPA: dicarboxylate/amino acid:cation symporter [Gemmatimonadaceae bacterium]|nr:dicarboxylate/amino acid:cation symporter [Gemmatimonadaceae bacterium]